MAGKIKPNAEPEYQILYEQFRPKDTNLFICIGGRGGKKTHSVSKFAAYSAAIKKRRIVILRDEKALIKESILNEIWARYDHANQYGALDAECIKNDTELKDKKTGKTLIYTKGFRASDLQKKANMKGPSDIDIAIIEEGEDIRDKTKYDTFVDGLRKEGCIVIIMLNTPDISHFLVKRFFNLEVVEDGYYRLVPKEIPGFVCIQTTYKDNPYLPAHIIERYEGYGNPSHHLYDKHYYLTAILGLASSGRKGQIFTKVKPIKREDYIRLPFVEYYGQDFGTASPAALVGVKFDGNKAYVRLINYKPLPALELGKLYCKLKFTHQDKIICDYAEPDTINKLANGWRDLSPDVYVDYPKLASGFYAVKCPAKDIPARISLMTSMELYAVEEDIELWDEINNFVYSQDKYGNYTNDPVDDYNHAFFDAAGYVIVDQRGKNKNFAM